MKRPGISYAMTLAVAGVVLLITGVLVLAAFSGQLNAVTDLLGMQNEQSTIDLCRERVRSFCAESANQNADWATQYPDCGEYANQIDQGGDTTCPLSE